MKVICQGFHRTRDSQTRCAKAVAILVILEGYATAVLYYGLE